MPAEGSIVATIPTARGEIVIRYPHNGDAPALLEYINTISREQTFILFQGQQLTLDQEEAWLRARLAEIASGAGITLGAWESDQVVGTAGIAFKPLAERHVGVFGISVAADCRGMGIGAKLLETVISEAETHLSGIRIIELGVFSNNSVAHGMYEKHGFIEFGRLPGGILHRGDYVDHIYMYRTVGAQR